VKKLKEKVDSLQSSFNSTVNFTSSTPCGQLLDLKPISESPAPEEQQEFGNFRPFTANLCISKLPAKLSLSVLRKKLKRHSADYH
jgi:hypothetical protein